MRTSPRLAASLILTAIILRGVMKARQLLAEKPHLAKANIYTAAAVGDVAAVADFLTKNADVHAKGGPFDGNRCFTRRTHDSTAKPKSTRR